jgi:hypothetical protein
VSLLLAALLVAVAVTVALDVDDAGACSCAGTDPRDRLAKGEPAVIGRVVAKRPQADTLFGDPGFDYTVRVERALNADLGPEVTVTAGRRSPTCGLEWTLGERIGAFVRRFRDRWATNLCSLVAPGELRRAATPYPRALGRGRASLLAGGQFGSARLMALDRRGRIVGYGFGRGTTRRISVCPGSRRMVELVDSNSSSTLATRDLRSLRVLRSLEVPRSTIELSCANRSAKSVFAAAIDHPRGRRLGRVRLLRITKRRAVRLATKSGNVVAFGGDFAFVGGTRRVLAVDLRHRRTRVLAAVRDARLLAATPSGARIAVLDEGGLRVVDTATGGLRAVSVKNATAMVWLPRERLLVRRGRSATLYDVRLRRLRRYAFYRASGQARVGGRLFGVAPYRLVSIDLGSGRRRTEATLPDRDVLDLESVPGAPRIETRSAAPRSATSSRACRVGR